MITIIIAGSSFACICCVALLCILGKHRKLISYDEKLLFDILSITLNSTGRKLVSEIPANPDDFFPQGADLRGSLHSQGGGSGTNAHVPGCQAVDWYGGIQ